MKKRITIEAKSVVASVSEIELKGKTQQVEIKVELPKVIAKGSSNDKLEIEVIAKGLGGESIPEAGIGRYAGDTFKQIDTAFKGLSKPFTEASRKISDATFLLHPNKRVAEEKVFTETFSRVATFFRSFGDGPQFFAADYLLDAPSFVETGKNVLDSIALAFSRVLSADSFGKTDSVTLGIHPLKIDTAALSESYVLMVSKAVNEIVRPTDDVLGEANIDDDQTAFVIKVLNNTSIVAEDFSRTVSFNRVFSEAESTIDVRSAAISKILSDSLANLDLVILEAIFNRDVVEIKAFTDSLTTSVNKESIDLASTSDFTSLIASKVNQEGVSSQENFSKTIALFKDESEYWAEDYADPSYEVGTVDLRDLFVSGLSKVQISSSTANDSILVLSEFNRDFLEISSCIESISRLFSKLLSDNFGKADSVVKAISPSIRDTTKMTESKAANIQNFFSSAYVTPGYAGTNYIL